MADNSVSSKIPMPSLMFILICLIGTLAFYLVAILPDQRRSAHLKGQVQKTSMQIDVHQVLAPKYRELREVFEQSRQIGDLKLPAPERRKLDQNGTYMIQPILEEIVQESHLKAERIELDVEAIIEDANLLSVQLSLLGDLVHFRAFLLTLNERLASLEHIERMRIQRVEGTKQLSLDLKIWLARA